MKKVFYTTSAETLIFSRQGQSVAIDASNALFSPIVGIINQIRPKEIILNGLFDQKVYLMLLRAIDHSMLSQFVMKIFIHKNEVAEDYLFPFSKIFGEVSVNFKREEHGNGMFYHFNIARSVPVFQYPIGFYVVSNGSNREQLLACLESIFSQQVEKKLVAVVGPSKLQDAWLLDCFPELHIIVDDDIYSDDLRFPISRKKNLVLKDNRAERVVILHDRIVLGKGWAKRLLEDVPFFDIYTCRITAGNHIRYLDKFGVKFSGYLTFHKSLYYLSYQEDNAGQFVDGGFFVLNTRALAGNQFDERLHWSECEDIDFIIKQKNNCRLISFDAQNQVSSVFAGHFFYREHSLIHYLYKILFRRLQCSDIFVRGSRFFKKQFKKAERLKY